MKKKLIGLFLIAMCVFYIPGIIGKQAQASAISAEEMKQKLDTLRNTVGFRDGDTNYGNYHNATQCMGFAVEVCYRLFNEDCRQFYVHGNVDNLCVGDHVRYRSSYWDHSIVVTNISGNTVYFVDCNGAGGTNKVAWRSTTKSQISSWISQRIWETANTKRNGYGYIETQKDNWVRTLDGVGEKDTESPQISDVTYKRTSDGYIVSCKVIDNTGVAKVLFPTWTANNDQDDLDSQWATENSKSKGTRNGNYYTFCVKMADHNNEEGIYYTHIYAYDSAGNTSSSSITINVYRDTEPPVIKNVKVTQKDSLGYTIQCEVTDNKKLDRVQFPTWTAYNSQDDLCSEWNVCTKCSGTIKNNTVIFRVNISDHNNESGIYKTHIYAYDECGNNTCIGQLVLVNSKGYSPISEVQNNVSRYMFFENPYSLNWDELKQYCELIGGHLATITSESENKLLENEAARHENTYYFIGASDKEKEGDWKWVTGGNMVVYKLGIRGAEQ